MTFKGNAYDAVSCFDIHIELDLTSEFKLSVKCMVARSAIVCSCCLFKKLAFYSS